VQLSEELKKKLAALSNDFSSQLEDRYKELEDAIAVLSRKPEVENVAELRLLVHKLAGSAATFGYDQLSLHSKEFEAYLDDIITRGEGPSEEEIGRIKEFFDYIRGESESEGTLEEIDEEEDRVSSTASGTKIEGVESTNTPEIPHSEDEQGKLRQIYLFGFVDEDLQDMSHQLGFYGYTAQGIESFSEMEKLLAEGKRITLFVDTCALTEEKSLSAMKRAHGERFTEVFISNDDTFELRLRAIRAGGDAFFVRPLDMGKVVDKIDNIASRGRAEPFHVLIVDDDQEQVAYYALILQQAGMITSVASDPMTVLSILVEARPDLILMDVYMPGCSGLELTQLLRQHEAFITIPIVFLSLENDRDRQMEAIGEGGDDFLIKPINPDYLVSIVRLRAQRNRNLRYFMERDSLTGLLNHSNLKEQLSREIIRAERSESPVSFAMIDADHFKNVNDTYGHLTGDRVLKSLARMLQDRLRRTDIIGRYGGEEFGVILINTGPTEAKKIMEEIRENFGRVRHHSENQDFYVTFSCGVASYPEIEEPEEISTAADEALYEAKESGRNRVVVFTRENAGPNSIEPEAGTGNGS
jgi:diguanylate cyclase (GGDEF)-like protein